MSLILFLRKPLIRHYVPPSPELSFYLCYTPSGVKAFCYFTQTYYILSWIIRTYFKSEEAPLCRIEFQLITTSHGNGIPPDAVQTSSVGKADTFPKGEGYDLFRRQSRHLPQKGRQSPLPSAMPTPSPKGKAMTSPSAKPTPYTKGKAFQPSGDTFYTD